MDENVPHTLVKRHIERGMNVSFRKQQKVCFEWSLNVADSYK